MSSRKPSRRDILRATAATGALFATGGAFAQDKPKPIDLPQGAKGKLTVIHRTEYFEQAQTLFRDTVVELREGQQRGTRHLDDQPGIVRRLHGQDDRRGEGRQPA